MAKKPSLIIRELRRITNHVSRLRESRRWEQKSWIIISSLVWILARSIHYLPFWSLRTWAQVIPGMKSISKPTIILRTSKFTLAMWLFQTSLEPTRVTEQSHSCNLSTTLISFELRIRGVTEARTCLETTNRASHTMQRWIWTTVKVARARFGTTALRYGVVRLEDMCIWSRIWLILLEKATMYQFAHLVSWEPSLTEMSRFKTI